MTSQGIKNWNKELKELKDDQVGREEKEISESMRKKGESEWILICDKEQET